jgi:biotin synthase
MPATVRSDWTIDEITAVYEQPLMELVRRASDVHRACHDPDEVQVNQLLSIKTGACPEDCGYCSQSVHYDTGVRPEPLMDVDDVVRTARRAQQAGVTRFCMGAAWREVKDNAQFDRVCDIVRQVNDLGMEVCVTLGMLNEDQAQRLAAAGLYAYNHNLDTSPEYYDSVITTRTYQDRLDTLAAIRTTNVTVCCGGIIGLGETDADRVSFLHQLATMTPHPESVPINVLSRVPGTPLEDAPDVDISETVRMIATARVVLPDAQIRIAAGRHLMGFADQALCFLAGANSVFTSERNMMLTETTPCADHASDRAMLDAMGLRMRVLDTADQPA